MFSLIRNVFRCEPLPWTFAYLLFALALIAPFILDTPRCTVDEPGHIPSLFQAEAYRWTGLVLSLLIPLWFRRLIKDASVLEFNERISLYPIYLLLLTAQLSCQSFVWILLVILQIILVVMLLRIKEHESLNGRAFQSAFLISLASFISPLVFIFIPLSILGLSLHRQLNWKNFVWSMLGTVSPWYLATGILYISTGQWNVLKWLPTFFHPEEPGPIMEDKIFFIGYIVLILVIGLLMIQRSIAALLTAVVKRRRYIRTGLLMLIASLILSALLYQEGQISPFLSLIAVPMAILSQELMRPKYEKLDSILFILWLGMSVYLVWN